MPLATEGDQLDGPSSYLLYSRARLWIFAPVLVLLLMLALMSAGVQQSWFTNGLIVLMLVSSIPYSAILWWAWFKELREVRAGYTTMPRSHRKVAQRDPYLGLVIRAPGEKYLRSDEFRDICTKTKP